MQKEKEKLQKSVFKALKGKSLFIMGPMNRLRLFCSKIVCKPSFDNIILIFIGISTILLALENPLNDPEGNLMDILYYLDITMTIIFLIEAMLKIIVYGLVINGKNSYLRNGWNIMDFVIVAFSVSISFDNLRRS